MPFDITFYTVLDHSSPKPEEISEQEEVFPGQSAKFRIFEVETDYATNPHCCKFTFLPFCCVQLAHAAYM